MNDFDNIPIMPPSFDSAPGPAGWIQIWIKAVTKPNEQTFIDITEDSNASSRTAYIWVFLAGTVSGIIQAIASTVRIAIGAGSQFQQIPGLEQYLPQSSGAGGGSVIGALIGGLCASPIAGIFSVIFFALLVAIVQWIAKLFGGVGTYDKLLYAFAAITLPFTLISSVLALFSIIPFVGICFGVISLGLSFYALALQVIAVKGVNRFGWGQAAGSVFIPGCTVMIICACVAVGSLMILGPAIENIFNGINQSLQGIP